MTLHRWNLDLEHRLAASDCDDGCSRNVKVCRKCRIFKITIMSDARAFNEWRSADGKEIYTSEPRCLGEGVPAL